MAAAVLTLCVLTLSLILGLGMTIGWPWSNVARSVQGFKAPLPVGASGGSLDSVACPSPSTCVGIGSYSGRSRSFPVLVVTGDGSGWKANGVTLATGAGSVGTEPLALAGTTVFTCVGVGSYYERPPTSHGPAGYTEGLLVIDSRGTWKATK